MDKRWSLVSLNANSHFLLQEETPSRSDCSRRLSEGEDMRERQLVSSAKRNNLVKRLLDGRSLMYIRNKRGPRMLPWGTPEITGREEEEQPEIETCCCLPSK